MLELSAKEELSVVIELHCTFSDSRTNLSAFVEWSVMVELSVMIELNCQCLKNCQ